MPSGYHQGLKLPFQWQGWLIHTQPFSTLFWQLLSYSDSWKLCPPWEPEHCWWCCFFSPHSVALVGWDQQGYSLCCVLERKANLESCFKFITSLAQVKSQRHIWSSPGLFPSSLSWHCFSPAPFHGWLKTGSAPLEWGQSRRCKEGFSSTVQTPGHVTEPRESYQLHLLPEKRLSDGIWIWHRGQPAAGANGITSAGLLPWSWWTRSRKKKNCLQIQQMSGGKEGKPPLPGDGCFRQQGMTWHQTAVNMPRIMHWFWRAVLISSQI